MWKLSRTFCSSNLPPVCKTSDCFVCKHRQKAKVFDFLFSSNATLYSYPTFVSTSVSWNYQFTPLLSKRKSRQMLRFLDVRHPPSAVGIPIISSKMCWSLLCWLLASLLLLHHPNHLKISRNFLYFRTELILWPKQLPPESPVAMVLETIIFDCGVFGIWISKTLSYWWSTASNLILSRKYLKTNFSKAFDRVSHDGLLAKPNIFGAPQASWISRFFSEGTTCLRSIVFYLGHFSWTPLFPLGFILASSFVFISMIFHVWRGIPHSY